MKTENEGRGEIPSPALQQFPESYRENPVAHGADTDRTPWATAALLGLSSMVIGGSGPVYDSYVPRLLEHLLDKNDLLVGMAMGVDNVTALLLVPFFGAWSDRIRTPLGRRVPFVLTAMPALALACVGLPFGADLGIALLFLAIVVFSAASAAMRAPMQALLADLVPSPHRTRVNGLLSVMMCLGAMPMIALSSKLFDRDPHLPFVLVGSLILVVWVVYSVWLREPDSRAGTAQSPTAGEKEDVESTATFGMVRSLLAHPDKMLLRFFLGALLFHMGFQAFSSWFTTYGAERYHVPINECSKGFMFVGASNLLASMPAGFAGARFGRKACSLFGIVGMGISCAGLLLVTTLGHAYALLAMFGATWSFALVNLVPMMLELGGTRRAATFAGAFLVCMSVGGMLGPAICGLVFDLAHSKTPFFGVLTAYLAGAGLLIGSLRRGFGEAASA